MGQPAAKQGDRITAIDNHFVIVPGVPPQPQLLPHPFIGIINGNLSSNVNVMGLPAATVGSTADNTPPHIPTPLGTSFQSPPANRGTIRLGSPTVRINGKMAARHGDVAETCNDPVDLPIGQVIAISTVFIG
ncbi:MAG: PAAR domain-containing protein [Scytonema sp. PMC 1069.18]|nr:PAAR domain-containing protein [Scytonema sp. PMC 1069.18]MEC4883961.1 PAAR domain-containing protein [Scytonema sp. PMC 1070.18]